jgi:membrane protease YdiL (CAAX protease family)
MAGNAPLTARALLLRPRLRQRSGAMRASPISPLPWRWLAGATAVAVAGAWVAAVPLGLRAGPTSALALLWLLAGAPLVEELLLRPGLQRGLEHWLALRHGPDSAAPAAAALATAAFALLHAPQHGAMAFAWLLPGALLAETWRRSGSLAACVALHALMNLTWWGCAR